MWDVSARQFWFTPVCIGDTLVPGQGKMLRREVSMSSEHGEDIGLKGVLVTDIKGKCLLASGIAEDVRIRAIISDSAWLKEAAERRFVPILLNNGQFVSLVSPFPEGYVVLISSPPADTVLQFVMRVDFAFDILNHILNDPYDAMTIVDEDAKMAYISPVHEK
ncbi:MAG: hypothetical protein ABIH17_03135, partial [Pseudomonadota bacterium]